ncbi:MAG: tetratricopeptide repeat protein [Cyclobacteriaceae bacterium]
MKRLLSLFWIILFLGLAHVSLRASTPQDKIDSLQSALHSHQNEELADLYNQISWEYRNTNTDSAVHYANLANQLSKSIGYTNGNIQSLNYLGIGYRNKSNYSKAFEYFVEALKASEESGNLEQEGYSLINIGNIYIYQTNYVGAIEYFENALKPARKLNNKGMMAYCYLNLGRTYSRIEQYDKAEDYYLKTRDIRQELNDTNGIITSNADIAELYRLRGNLDKALEFFTLSLNDTRKIDNNGALAFSLNNIAKIYRQKNDLKNAQKYALEALEVAKDFELKNDERKVLENLSLIYQQLGLHEKALQFYKDHIYKRDSIFNEETTRKIEEMRSKYKAEKQEVETLLLKRQAELDEVIIQRQKTVIVLTAIGIALLLVIAIVAYRSSLTRKKLNILISEQRDQALKDKNLIEQQSKKLEALDMAKSRFFHNISHDLRSPLSIIIGNQDEIIQSDENYLTKKSKQYLEVAHKNARRLLFLTDEINELTKLEEGKLQLKPVAVQIGPYLKLLVSMFQSTADFKEVDLQFENKIDETTTLELDPYQFEKIIYNLISNALKHSKSEDKVLVILDQGEKRDIIISIKDTGDGIPEASIPYIFDRYYQSPENKYHVYEGLGVGLALVKELVKLHKGSISVKSKPGIGTTFTVVLPNTADTKNGTIPERSDYILDKNSLWADLWEKTYQKEQPVKLNILNEASPGSKKILLVEDHPEVREYICGLLGENFQVIEVENGLKALETLKKETVDLIITDLMMPWMDGFELLENIQKNEKYNQIPVLVVSARNTDDDKFRVLTAGVSDILQKPINRTELLLRIDNLLNSHPANGKQNAPLIFNNTHLIDDLEKELLKKLEKLILERIDDSNLSVLHLADAMAASERKVYRMIKKLTNLTPFDYIKEVRWQYLEHLVKNKHVKNASEAAKSIGMKNVTNFKNQYRKRFNRDIEESLVKVS